MGVPVITEDVAPDEGYPSSSGGGGWRPSDHRRCGAGCDDMGHDAPRITAPYADVVEAPSLTDHADEGYPSSSGGGGWRPSDHSKCGAGCDDMGHAGARYNSGEIFELSSGTSYPATPSKMHSRNPLSGEAWYSPTRAKFHQNPPVCPERQQVHDDLQALPNERMYAGELADVIQSKQSAFFGNTRLHLSNQLTSAPSRMSTKQIRNVENDQALGGMRRPDLSVQAQDGYKVVGTKLRELLEQFVDKHPSALQVVEEMRAGRKVEGFEHQLMQELRSAWMAVLQTHATPAAEGPDAAVLEAWGRTTGDLDAAQVLPDWLRRGAPCGINEHIEYAGVPSGTYGSTKH